MTATERPAPAVEDFAVPGDGVDVRARLYRPGDDAPRTGRGVVWVHGGGFVWGDLDMPESDWVARELASAGHVVLAVDYRLVTGGDIDRREFAVDAAHRFPAAHLDVLAAVRWLAASAEALGVDPARLVLGGASAGGNLAAGAAMRLRDDAGVAPSDLILAYPVAHAALPDHSPAVAAAVAPLAEDQRFRPETVAAMNLNYVGDPALLSHAYAFPGGHDVAGMPRTLIVNSEHDDLRSTGERFAAELAAAGVDTECVLEPETVHGHLNRPEHPAAGRSLATMLRWIDSGDPLLPPERTFP